MAKVKIQGHASGTGVLTVTAPNTSTDRTITLPDSTATLATTADVPSSITDNGDATAITIDSSEKVALGGSGSVSSDSQVAIKGGNLELTTAGSKYWIARASDGALTGSLYSPSGSVVRLSGAGTSAGTIEFEPRSSNGVIARVTGDGLCFGSDTAAANALDDYEEGTWTPANQWITLTNNATARYVKIGSLVTVWANVTWASSPSDVSQTGGKIQGLPYTPVAGDFPWLPSHWVNTSTGARKDDSEYDYYLDNSTTMVIYSRPNSRVVQRQQVSGTQMKFTATYTTG